LKIDKSLIPTKRVLQNVMCVYSNYDPKGPGNIHVMLLTSTLDDLVINRAMNIYSTLVIPLSNQDLNCYLS